MKNLFTRLMLVAVAALSIVACQTEPEITTVPEKNTFTLTVTAEQETTRTYLGEADENGVYQAQWNNEGEVIRIFEYVNNSDTTSVASTGFEKLTDGTAKFTAELTKIDEATVIEDIDYYAIYPESNRIKSDNVDITAFKFNTPTEQTPTATSFDGNADFMIAKPVVNQTEQLTELSMSFKRLVSIGKMTLTNLDTESTIESVDLTFSLAEGAVAGYSSVDLTTSQYISCYQRHNTLKLSYNEPISKDTPIYFVSLPVCISAGDSFEIVVRTSDGCVFTRTVELTEGKEIKLTEGNMTGFKVNMSTADKQVPSTDVFTLLTDVNELNAGDKIIIAAAESNVALSTTQNGNNRGQASITKSEDGKISYGADVQILTVEAGTKADTFAFNTGSGYLFAASSDSNYLRTETTLSDNSSWTITIDATGVATIIAQGTNTRNYMQYNATSSLFACYAKNNNMKPVAIYYLDGEEPDYMKVSTDTISFTAKGGEKTFTVSKNFDAEVSVTCDNSLFAITPGENGSYTVAASVNETTEKITGAITVTAGEFTKTIAVTQEAKADDVDGNVNTVTYIVSSTSACTTEGTAPSSSTATYSQTYNTKEQLTSGNSATFTLSGYAGATIKAITLNMKSNASKGAGKFSAVAGTTTLAAISDATNFNEWYDNESYGSTYRDIKVKMINDTYVVQSGENIEIKFEATTNSIYIHSVTIDYIGGTTSGGDDNTGGDTGEDNDNPDVGGTATVVMSTFTETAASMDNVISYTTAKGGGTANPAINNDEIRLYQNSAGTGGGYITVTAAEGHTISSLTIGSSMATSVAYTLDSDTTKSTTASLSANGKYTIEQEAQSITIYCMGTSSSSRLYVNYLSVTYK